MVVYQGGKSRIGKKIHDIIILIEDVFNNTEYNYNYFEPFVGVGSVLRHFGDDDDRNLYACDINKDVICMLKALQKNWDPPNSTSEKEYNELKKSKKHSAKRCFIGLVGSWGGNFFQGGYRLKGGKKQGYVREGRNSLLKLRPSLKNVKFWNSCSYYKFNPKNMLVYADPPYIGNCLGNKKGLFQQFDHVKFWNEMRRWSKNNIVVISEWKAPKDFKMICSLKSYVSSGNTKKTKRYSDNLYIHESLYKKIDSVTKRKIRSICN